MPDLFDVIVEDKRWADIGLCQLANDAGLATLAALQLENPGFEIALLACDDDRISILNSDFRGKDQATNVLSWPSVDLTAEHEGQPPHKPGQDKELGDIALAFETCEREAADQNKSLKDHVSHLLVHGMLHLLGYDHVREKDALLMEGLETQILAKLGIADPY